MCCEWSSAAKGERVVETARLIPSSSRGRVVRGTACPSQHGSSTVGGMMLLTAALVTGSMSDPGASWLVAARPPAITQSSSIPLS